MSFTPPRLTDRKAAAKKKNKDVWDTEFGITDCPWTAEECYDDREINGDGFVGTEWGGENFASFKHLTER